jgi:alpha-tubulin suppressor-like RCC1 family protein
MRCRGSSPPIGGHHGCAQTFDGRVFCWGANDRGQLGDGTLTDRPDPTQVAGLDPASTLAVAWMGDHDCAITHSGELRCWGANDRGEIGDGTTSDRWQPTLTRF